MVGAESRNLGAKGHWFAWDGAKGDSPLVAVCPGWDESGDWPLFGVPETSLLSRGV